MDYSKDYNNLPNSFFDGDEEYDSAEEELRSNDSEDVRDSVVSEV